MFPHLRQLGIEVTFQDDLPELEEVYLDFLREMRRASPGPIILLSPRPADPGRQFPALGQWVHHTHIKDSTPGEKGVSYVLTGDGTIGVRDVVKALAAGGYKGYYGFEWEKHWHPEIAEPDVAFPQYAKVMSQWLAESGVTPR